MKYEKGSRAVKTSLLTFSSQCDRLSERERDEDGPAMEPNTVKGRRNIYNENNQEAPAAYGKEILLIIGSIKALLKCNSLTDKPRHCPLARFFVMVI